MSTPSSSQTDRPAVTTGAYEALRRGGGDPAAVRRQLGREAAAAARLEAAFRARAARGVGDAHLPKFARHAQHVAAVMGEGGFPALSERRKGRDGACVCLPMIRPGGPAPSRGIGA